jgi:hypothetical protein
MVEAPAGSAGVIRLLVPRVASVTRQNEERAAVGHRVLEHVETDALG